MGRQRRRNQPGSPGLGAGHSYGYDEFSDIQSGINAVASGGIVDIYAGTYDPSNILIPIPVTIEGLSESGVIIKPSLTDSHDDSSFGGTASNGFIIASSHVTIETLTLDGGAGQDFRDGIITNSANDGHTYSDITIQHVTIENVYRKGIAIYNYTGLATGIVIENDTLNDIGTTINDGGAAYEATAAIAVFGSDATIENNVITNSAAGIEGNTFDGSAALFTITGNSYSSPQTVLANGALGIDVASAAGGSVVSANPVDLTGTGTAHNDIGIVVSWDQGAVTVSGNTVTGQGGDNGILLYQDATAVAVSGNTVQTTSSDTGVGILVTAQDSDTSRFGDGPGPVAATITANPVSGFATGVEVASDGLAGDTASANIGDGTSPGSNTISKSDWGILVKGSGASADINDNSIQNFQNYGVQLAYNAYGTVTGNTIVAPDGGEAGVSIYDFTQGGSTVNVTNNNVTIAQNGWAGIWANLFHPSTAATLNISDNHVYGANNVADNLDSNGNPYPVFGIYLTTLDSSSVIATLDGNTVTSYSPAEPLAAGIGVWNAPGASISVGDDLSSNHTYITNATVGIDLDNVNVNFGGSTGTTTLSVTNAVISGGSEGVRVAAVPSDYPGAPLYYNPDLSNNVAQGSVALNLSGGSITGATTGIDVEALTVPFTATAYVQSNAAISGGTTGILVSGAKASATIIGNDGSIYGNTVGIDVNGGTATITNNHIYNNTTGIIFENGGTTGAGSVAGNDFTGATANVTDLYIASTAGSVTIGDGNKFDGSNYFINNQSSQNFDLSAFTSTVYGSYNPATLTDNYRIEDRMYHKVDDLSKGLITWVANNLYVTAPGSLSGTTTDTDSTIQRGIDAASAGNVVNVEAGTFTENVTVNKQITLTGAGSGNTAGDTIVTAAVSGNPIITITGSGADATDRLLVENLRATGGADGVYFNSAVAHVTLDNVAAVSNTSYGIEVHNSAALSDLDLNAVSATNEMIGLRVSSQGTVNGLVITNSHFDSDTQEGLYTTVDTGRTDNQNGFTNVQISNTTFSNDSLKGIYLEKVDNATFTNVQVVNSGTTGGSSTGFNVNDKYGTFTNIALNNVSVIYTAAGTPELGIDIEGRNDGSYASHPASLSGVTLNGVTVSGALTAMVLANNVTGVSFSGVNLSGSTLDLLLQNTPAQSYSLGNTIFAATAGGYIDNLTANPVDATGATFAGTPAASLTLSQAYAVEDKILDAVDVSGLGLVRIVATNVYVTPNSYYAPLGTITPSIQRGVDAATAGDTVYVEAGTYVNQVEIDKAITLTGAGNTTIIDAPATLPNSFTPTNDGVTYYPVVLVQGANATVENLEIDGGGYGNANNRLAGLAFYNAGGTATGLTVTGTESTPLNGVQAGYGIIARSDDSAVRGLSISDNTVEDYQKNGIERPRRGNDGDDQRQHGHWFGRYGRDRAERDCDRVWRRGHHFGQYDRRQPVRRQRSGQLRCGRADLRRRSRHPSEWQHHWHQCRQRRGRGTGGGRWRRPVRDSRKYDRQQHSRRRLPDAQRGRHDGDEQPLLEQRGWRGY